MAQLKLRGADFDLKDANLGVARTQSYRSLSIGFRLLEAAERNFDVRARPIERDTIWIDGQSGVGRVKGFVNALAFVGEGGVAGDDEAVADARKLGGEVLGHAVREIILTRSPERLAKGSTTIERCCACAGFVRWPPSMYQPLAAARRKSAGLKYSF